MSTLWNFLQNNAEVIGIIIGFVGLLAPIIWRVAIRIGKAMQAANDRRMKEFADILKSELKSDIAASEASLKDYVKSEIAASEARLKDYVKYEIAASEARLKEYFWLFRDLGVIRNKHCYFLYTRTRRKER